MAGAMLTLLVLAAAFSALGIAAGMATKGERLPLKTVLPGTVEEYRRQLKRAENGMAIAFLIVLPALLWALFIVLAILREVASWL